MKIGIIGNGVVGNATAEAFRPTEVRCYDKSPERSPNTLEQALACDIVFVCLPTPQCANLLDCDLSVVYDFFRARGHDAPNLNYVLRSTVPVGTTRRLHEQFNLPNLVHSPEFLTARTAIQDAKMPKQLLIGYPEPHPLAGADTLYDLYKQRWPAVPIGEMTSDESETIKLAQNAFSAVKIAFFNELRSLCDAKELNWDIVRAWLLGGGWINSMHTQVPGPDGKRGFGGACLPKDLASFISCLRNAGLPDNVSFAAHTRNKGDRK